MIVKKFLIVFMVLAWVVSCSSKNTTRNAPSKHSRETAQSKPAHHMQDSESLTRTIRSAKQKFTKLLQTHKKNVARRWGKNEVKMSSSHIFVKYTQNYKSRAIVKFDPGLISIETLDKSNSTQSLKDTIVATLLTPSDPRSIEMFSAKTNRLSGRPFFYGMIKDQRKQNINTKKSALKYASYLVKNRLKVRSISINGSKSTVYYVNIRMINDHQHVRARRYTQYINKYASRYRVNRSLVYAIIETESNFNPYAISSAPAYGLMQIVPRSAGRDAYKKIYGTNKTPSSAFLLNDKNNIQMGIAYINILSYRYLAKIRNPVSREYCLIAAYNTGIGNVFSIFSKKQSQAINQINQLSSLHLYQYLRKNLRYKEARDYLYKVVKEKPHYANFQ